MPKRISDTERIVQFFMNCEAPEFDLQMEVIRAIRTSRFGPIKVVKRQPRGPSKRTNAGKVQTKQGAIENDGITL